MFKNSNELRNLAETNDSPLPTSFVIGAERGSSSEEESSTPSSLTSLKVRVRKTPSRFNFCSTYQ